MGQQALGQQALGQQALFSGDEATIASAMALLIHYYDLAPASSRLLLSKWLQQCPAAWTRAAVIEALYQGRYRAVSVEQILALWLRRGKPTSHFNREFEALIAVPIQQALVTGQAAALAAEPRPHYRQPVPLAPGKNSMGTGSLLPSDTPFRARSPQMHQPPIDQFTPAEDVSGFAIRMKEVAGQFPMTESLEVQTLEVQTLSRPQLSIPSLSMPDLSTLERLPPKTDPEENSPSEDSV